MTDPEQLLRMIHQTMDGVILSDIPQPYQFEFYCHMSRNEIAARPVLDGLAYDWGEFAAWARAHASKIPWPEQPAEEDDED